MSLVTFRDPCRHWGSVEAVKNTITNLIFFPTVQYQKFSFKASRLWLRLLALTFQDHRPGQKPSQAKVLAQLGPASFGSAWPGLWPQARAGTSLCGGRIPAICHNLDTQRYKTPGFGVSAILQAFLKQRILHGVLNVSLFFVWVAFHNLKHI